MIRRRKPLITNRSRVSLILAAIFGLSMAGEFALVGSQAAAVPKYISLQGQLTGQNVGGGSGNVVAEDGVYTIAIRVYESPTGSSAVWEDTFENLPLINGVFNILLGSQLSLDNVTLQVPDPDIGDLLDLLAARGQLYVGLTITHKDGTELVGPVEMLPRLSLVPMALAFKSVEATNAQLLDNKHWDLFFSGVKAKHAILADTATQADSATLADAASSVDASNITGQIGTAGIADGAVTVEKREPIPNDQAQITPYIKSGKAYLGTPFFDVAGMEVTIEATGRPVFIMIANAAFDLGVTSSASLTLIVRVLRNGVSLGQQTFHMRDDGPGNNRGVVMGNGLWLDDDTTPGTRIYKVQIFRQDGTGPDGSELKGKFAAFEL